MGTEFGDLKKALGILVLVIVVPPSAFGLLIATGEALGLGTPVYVYVVHEESPDQDAAIQATLESSLHELGFDRPPEIDRLKCKGRPGRYTISSLNVGQPGNQKYVDVFGNPCDKTFRFEVRANPNAEVWAKLVDLYFRAKFRAELKTGTLRRTATTRIDMS